MINGKTYYQILGVIVDADDVVIKAAYRSLSSKFHPDRWLGDPKVAHELMVEINAAYGVLGDASKRVKYDEELRLKGVFSDLGDGSGQPETEAAYDTPSEDQEAWDIAVQFYPDLNIHYVHLKQLNRALAESYKYYLVSEKSFHKRLEISNRLEAAFLKKYFGPSREIQHFALSLIKRGERAASLDLNKFVNVMGSSASPADIIAAVNKKYFSNGENPINGNDGAFRWDFRIGRLAQITYNIDPDNYRGHPEWSMLDAAKELCEVLDIVKIKFANPLFGSARVEVFWQDETFAISPERFLEWVRSEFSYNIILDLPIERHRIVPP